MPLQLRLEMTESSRSFHRKLAGALSPLLTEALLRAAPEVKDKSKQIMRRALFFSDEYISLVGGQLRGELGIPNAPATVLSLIEKIVNKIDVEVKRARRQGESLRGTLNVILTNKSVLDLSNEPETKYITDKGLEINWYNWLTFRGEDTIIRGYDAVFADFSSQPFSRSGLGLMYPGEAKMWHVPRAFRGSLNDNWISRAISRELDALDKAVEGIILKELKR